MVRALGGVYRSAVGDSQQVLILVLINARLTRSIFIVGGIVSNKVVAHAGLDGGHRSFLSLR